MTTKKLQGNKTFLIIGLSIVVVVPLLIVTFIIGKAALWLWLGLFVGAAYMTWEMKRNQKKQQKEKNSRGLLDYTEITQDTDLFYEDN
jgi:4-hydroxybenzoate polyprenyltransferase